MYATRVSGSPDVTGTVTFRTVRPIPMSSLLGVLEMLLRHASGYFISTVVQLLASVLLLMRYKDGDANVRSVWLCSRNDAIGNVVVMMAALGVWGTSRAWPDLAVASLMAAIFCTSSVQILRQAWAEHREKSNQAHIVPAE